MEELVYTFVATAYGTMFLGKAATTTLQIDAETGMREFSHGGTLILIQPMVYRVVDMPGNIGFPVLFTMPMWKSPAQLQPLVFAPEDVLVLDQEVPVGIIAAHIQSIGVPVAVEPGEQH